MEFLTQLWLPILSAAALVFVVSSLVHMVIPLHKGDHRKLPGEEQLLEAMRAQGVAPGSYMFPCPASMKEMGDPGMVARFERGPVGQVTVVASGPPRIGRFLVQWFLFSVLVSVFLAYLAWHALHASDPAYLDVFRLVGTAAFLTYGIAIVPDSIWKGTSWRITAKFVFDGLLYALVTAGAFAGFWPHG